MATLYGSDFSVVDDFDAKWTFLEGEKKELLALAQAIARRLGVPRFGNPWDPAYGYDLRMLVSSSTPPSTAETSISAECRKDERIADATARITVVGDTWTVVVTCTPVASGPFSLTLSVSQVSVALLKVET